MTCVRHMNHLTAASMASLGTPKTLPVSSMSSLEGKLLSTILTGMIDGSEALSTAEICFKINGKISLRANPGTPAPMARNPWNEAVVIGYPISLSLDVNRCQQNILAETWEVTNTLESCLCSQSKRRMLPLTELCKGPQHLISGLYSNTFINNSSQDIKLMQCKFWNLFIKKGALGRKVKMTQVLLCHMHILSRAAGSCHVPPRLVVHPGQEPYQRDCPGGAAICILPHTRVKYPAWHPFPIWGASLLKYKKG